MTTKTVTDTRAAVIEDRSQLIDSFARGEKPKERWRIGTEHEKFVYSTKDLHAPSYNEPGGIRELLRGLTEFGWKPGRGSGPDHRVDRVQMARSALSPRVSSNCQARRSIICTRPVPRPRGIWSR